MQHINGVADQIPIEDRLKMSYPCKRLPRQIPRPRNAFIVFRCAVVRHEGMLAAVKRDHRNIFRVAGKLWREMGVEGRKVWVEIARREKRMRTSLRNPRCGRHENGFPSAVLQDQAIGECEKSGDSLDILSLCGQGMRRVLTNRIGNYLPDLPQSSEFHRRSSSCPQTSAFSVSALDHPDASDVSLVARDDIYQRRRPNQKTMFCHLSENPVGSPVLVSSAYGVVGQPRGSTWDEVLQPFEWTSEANQNLVSSGSARMKSSNLSVYTVWISRILCSNAVLSLLNLSALQLEFREHAPRRS
jgi:hypothetical protein